VPALVTLNFVSTFVPIDWGRAEIVRGLFPRVRFQPLHLENYGEYRRLVTDLEKLPADSLITIYGSSGKLSDSLIAALEPKLHSKLIWNSHVDLRDRFKTEALGAGYVVVGTPTPTHLREIDQRVITLPAELIRSGQGIGQAFVRLPSEYRLEGTMARIYRRTRPFTVEEVSDFLDRLYDDYPAWSGDYRADLYVAMVEARIAPGDRVGAVRQISANELFVHPGDRSASSIDIPLSANFRPSRVTIRVAEGSPSQCAEADGTAVKVESEAQVFYDQPVLPGKDASVAVPQAARLSLSIAPQKNSVCDHVTVTFSF
jgi:hypothetical protein